MLGIGHYLMIVLVPYPGRRAFATTLATLLAIERAITSSFDMTLVFSCAGDSNIATKSGRNLSPLFCVCDMLCVGGEEVVGNE